MYEHRSRFFLSENSVSYRERNIIGRTLKLPDGSRARVVSIERTPRDLWLKLRPGGWVQAAAVLEDR